MAHPAPAFSWKGKLKKDRVSSGCMEGGMGYSKSHNWVAAHAEQGCTGFFRNIDGGPDALEVVFQAGSKILRRLQVFASRPH